MISPANATPHKNAMHLLTSNYYYLCPICSCNSSKSSFRLETLNDTIETAAAARRIVRGGDSDKAEGHSVACASRRHLGGPVRSKQPPIPSFASTWSIEETGARQSKALQRQQQQRLWNATIGFAFSVLFNSHPRPFGLPAFQSAWFPPRIFCITFSAAETRRTPALN